MEEIVNNEKKNRNYRKNAASPKRFRWVKYVSALVVIVGVALVYLFLTGFFSLPGLSKDVYYISEGETLKIQAEGTRGSSFSSENQDIATISSDGTLEGLSVGTTEITISNKYNKSDSAKVVVVAQPDSLTLVSDKESIASGEKMQISFDDGVEEIEHSVVYESLNPDIASVDAQTGEVTGISSGKAEIKGTLYNGVEEIITVYVDVTPVDFRIEDGNDSIVLVVGETSVLATTEENSQHLSFASSDTSVVSVAEDGTITAEAVGETTINVTRYNESDSCTVEVIEMPSSVLVDMPQICQKPDYYYACESVSAVMLLQGMGYDITPNTFIDDYLTIRYMTFTDEGIAAADMNSAFINNPYDSSGYGCFSPVIAKSINKYFSDIGETEYKAIYEKDIELSDVIKKYLAKEQPVLLWATTYMVASYPTDSWIVDYVDENAEYEIGDVFTFPYNEHCLLLVGYDDYYYYFNDPLYGSLVKYDKSLVELRYEQMGKQIVAVVPA